MNDTLVKTEYVASFIYQSSQSQLTRLHITCEGTIEDDGYGMLQVGIPTDLRLMPSKSIYSVV